MRYEDVEEIARKQFMRDIGFFEGEESDLRVVLNKRRENMPEGRRIYRKEGDFFRLIVFGTEAFILSDGKVSDWAEGFYGNRAPEFMLNFANLRELDSVLREHGLMIDEIQECFLPSFILFEPEEEVWEEEGVVSELSTDELGRLFEEGAFPHAIVNLDKEVRALGFKAPDSSKTVAMAGARQDGEFLWQIGVDVVREYRDRGIATRLVYELARRLILEDRLPFYGVRPGHIISKKTALAAGFEPAFSEVYIKQETQGRGC